MSFIEHQVHRKLMHRKNFLSDRLLPFKRLFEHHAILHHTHYRTIFSDEPVAPGEDRGIRLSMVEGVLEGLPIAAVIGIFAWQGAVMFLLVVCLHHYLWSKIHLEMHKPQDRFFSHWPIFESLAVHHYLHHKYPDKNFNVVFPLADCVLGTNVPATESDIEAYRAGLPQSKATAA